MNFVKFSSLLSVRKTCSQINSKKYLSIASLSNYRSLISVKGDDAAKFLQNLTTNNIFELSNQNQTQYGMILNNRGRIMYDVLLYFYKDHYLIELDTPNLEQALKYFKLYKIKKKAELNIEKDLNLYTVFNIDQDVNFQNSLIVRDPRYSDLGYRVVTTENLPVNSELKEYRKHLYQNGIAETTDDFVQGSSIPLEYNIEFLNGVSFDKGCYLGQELVAKTHYTGVVRKRIMPFNIKSNTSDKYFSKDNLILNKNTGQTVGKLKNLIDGYGIGMLRLANLDKTGLVLIDNNSTEHEIEVIVPKYWPKDLKDLKNFY